jgi:hypothetical protein
MSSSVTNSIVRALVDTSRALIAKGAPSAGFDVSMFEDQDRFTTWLPFEPLTKSEVIDPRIGLIEGVATTEAPDADGDIILTDGIDWSYFIGANGTAGKGFIIDEHPVGSHNVVGYPISISQTQVPYKDKLVKGTKVKAGLYLEDSRGKALFEKACTMRRAGGERRLGFSIEGSVKPGGRKGKVVEKSQVKWLAITAAPKNDLSWWEPVAKSIMAAAGVHAEQAGTVTESHLTMVAAQVFKSLNQADDIDAIAEALVVRLCKSRPTLTWAEATTVLQHVLRTVTQSHS